MGRPPIGKAAMSGAERTRQYRERLRHNKPVTKPARPDHAALVRELAQVKAELAQAKPLFEAELAQAKAQAMALVETELAQAKARIATLEVELRETSLKIAGQAQVFRDEVKRRAAKPKAEKPPLPPDEERDRIIKGLKTRVRNLTTELHHTREWVKSGAAKASGMSFATRNTIMKPLHLDSRKYLTGAEHLAGTELEAALDAGGKALNAWLDGLKPARR